jgi:hypothetical protein
MKLHKGFQFSQGSLQDYVDCRRRFYLRFVQRLSWPAVESEPMLESERYALQGKQFHKMIQQHLIGIPADTIAGMVSGEELKGWWQSYLDFYQQEDLAGQGALFPEISLSTPIGNQRLVATFDLIVVQKNGNATIYDWKTNRNRISRARLERRLQTRVYPTLLTTAGNFLNAGYPILPENIRMVYWFASFPEQPETFIYNAQTYHSDQKYLEHLVDKVNRAAESEFTLTDDEKLCQYCIYRSLCERGVQAGSFEVGSELDEDIIENDGNVKLDIDQIAEIAF